MTDAFEKIGEQWASIHFYWDISDPQGPRGLRGLAGRILHSFRRLEGKKVFESVKSKLEEIIRNYHPDIVHTTVGEI